MWQLARQRAFWMGILAGVLVGLFLGWFVWPVSYTDAYPSELREEDKLEYLRLVAHEFQRTQDVEALQKRLSTFDRTDLVPLFQQALEKSDRPGDREALTFTLTYIQQGMAHQGNREAPSRETGDAARSTGGGGLGRVLSIFLISVGVLFLAIAGYRALGLVRGKSPAPPRPVGPDWDRGREMAPQTDVLEPDIEEAPVSTASAAMPPHLEREDITPTAEATSPRTGQAPAPSLRLVQVFSPAFVVQTVGEEGYDEAFTIYGEGEENLGECGVGEVETLHGQPGQPIVMELWLFDKEDPETYQAYILTPWAHRQPDIRQKYEDQGPVFVGQHGGIIRLNARALYLEAEIKDVAFAQTGEGDEVFSKLALEVKVYRRIAPPA